MQFPGIVGTVGSFGQYLDHIGNGKPLLIVVNPLPDFLAPENRYACPHHTSRPLQHFNQLHALRCGGPVNKHLVIGKVTGW